MEQAKILKAEDLAGWDKMLLDPDYKVESFDEHRVYQLLTIGLMMINEDLNSRGETIESHEAAGQTIWSETTSPNGITTVYSMVRFNQRGNGGKKEITVGFYRIDNSGARITARLEDRQPAIRPGDELVTKHTLDEMFKGFSEVLL